MFGTTIEDVKTYFANTANSLSMTVGEVLAGVSDAERRDWKEDAIAQNARVPDAKKTTIEWLASVVLRSASKGGAVDNLNTLFDHGRSRYERTALGGTFDRHVPQMGYRRTLSELSERELALMRLAALLTVAGVFSPSVADRLRWSLVWNRGACDIVAPDFGNDGRARRVANDSATKICKDRLPAPNVALGNFIAHVAPLLKSADPLTRELIQSNINLENKWLDEAELARSPRLSAIRQPHSLFLGRLSPSRLPVYFNGEESLATIGRPGTGKTQAHVIPNLLQYPGPMIVLDVKGECFRMTANARAQLGPVIRFDPTDDKVSARYNPLEIMIDVPTRDVFSEARSLAELMILVTSRTEPAWELEARNLVAMILAYTGLTASTRGLRPSMDLALNLLSGLKFVDMMNHILNPSGPFIGSKKFEPLVRQAAHFRDQTLQSEKQINGVRMSATSNLAAWDSHVVSEITQVSDWHPSIFRGQHPPTLYLTVPLSAINTHKALLRVIIGQHIAWLMRTEPQPNQRPVVFMLDEFPALGNMAGITNALDTGRSYGIKLWFIMQYVSQLEAAYGSLAKGILGACGANIYLGPGADIASKLSDQLGTTVDLFTGKRDKLASAHDLTGPAYRDLQIALIAGERPARLTKEFAFRGSQSAA